MIEGRAILVPIRVVKVVCGGVELAGQRYRVVEKIDMGGMAEIYRGYSTSLEGIQKEVAIKRVLPQLTKNRKFVAMFLDEARLSMHLNHGNIVQVFDVGRADDTYFIVMEFVDGYNLRRIFQKASERNERIPPQLAAYMMLQVCHGLAHAHEKRGIDGDPLRIVHRDVSPPNVLISKAGEVKLTDFGLAKAVTQLELTDPGVVKGKFSYLAPEAAEGKTVDLRADLFAVGIVLFELVTNRRLFMGKTDVETVELVRKAEVPRVTKLNPDVPKKLEGIVDRALARDPKRRYPSARDLADALNDYLSDQSKRTGPIELSRFLEDLFATRDDQGVEERIDTLVAEEILNLSSLGLVGEALSGSGSRPVHPGDLSDESRGIGRLSLSEFWPDGDPLKPAALARLEAGSGAGALSGSESGLSMLAGSPWLWIALLGGFGAAAAAFFWLT